MIFLYFCLSDLCSLLKEGKQGLNQRLGIYRFQSNFGFETKFGLEVNHRLTQKYVRNVDCQPTGQLTTRKCSAEEPFTNGTLYG